MCVCVCVCVRAHMSLCMLACACVVCKVHVHTVRIFKHTAGREGCEEVIIGVLSTASPFESDGFEGIEMVMYWYLNVASNGDTMVSYMQSSGAQP